MKCYATRYYRRGVRRAFTELIYVDQLGKHVPLLDESGQPVNFERKPMALERAHQAMLRMQDVLEGDESDAAI